MKVSEERALKARAWSMACHHSLRGIGKREGLQALLAELAAEEIPITGNVAGICQLTYEAVREILSTGATYQDAFALAVP